jgi:hypothetical protein
VRRHLCLTLTGPVTGQVERWRHRWDPAMAAVVPAHVTVTYPEETTDEQLLLHRAARHTATTAPFRLRLGQVIADDGGRGGVFIAVHDVDGGWAALRRQLLVAPMTPLDVAPHVTVAHPRTSTRGEECLAALGGQHLDGTVLVREVLFTETTASSFAVLRRFPLPGVSRDP